MQNINKMLKNILFFLAIFLVINFIFTSFQDKDDHLNESGSIILTSTKDNYAKTSTVTLSLSNNTEENLVIPNECPGEPLNVYRYEKNEWIQKTANPELDCSGKTDLTITPNSKANIAYDNWSHALFSEMGRYKIEFTTTIEGKEKIIATPEFIVEQEGVFKQLGMGLFYKPIYNGLIYLTSVMPGYDLGFAIIILTIIIRTILLVPSHKAMLAQKKLQSIQPKLEKIKEKYKNDQQRIATETMAVWKEAKVNPFGSCLPLLLQFPFLIALFYVIKGGLNPDKAHLLYTTYENFQLTDVNVLFLGILNLTKADIIVLPVLVGGLQFLQMKLAMNKTPNKSTNNEMAMATNMMTYILPIMIGVFTASLPAGVGLYWGASTAYAIVQQIFINRSKVSTTPNDEPEVRVIEVKAKN